jgi:diguanylate cyclase (GGDEF)-like protein
VPLPAAPFIDKFKALWESRAGHLLQRVGLRSVRTTILTLAVLATLIPALATGLISYIQNRRAIEVMLNEQLTGSSAQAARESGLWLREQLNDLRVFASSYEVTDNLARSGSGRLRNYLNSVNERSPDFYELLVVGPDQRTVAFTGTTPGTLNFADDWLRKVRLGDPVLGEPRRADSASSTTMDVAVPIINVSSGRFLGAFIARLDFKGFEPRLADLLVSDDGRIRVVRPDGRSIVRIGGVSDSFPEATLRALELADGASVAYTATDGEEMLGVLAYVPGVDWMTIASIPAATAYADIRSSRNTSIMLVLGLLLVVGTLAYGLGLLVVLPLERLSHAADRVASGDLEQEEIPIHGGGEVSQLTRVFNDMVRRLREGRTELERLSVTDQLTGLSNRRHLDEELIRETERHERHRRTFAVLLLDIDHFKRLNDTHGHPAGDAVLRQFAKILQDNTRAGDCVARFGGEEFLVILPETPAAGALHLAEKIRATTEQHKFILGGDAAEVNVTVSMGLARFPEHGKTPETLIMVADEALYRSKQGGRNRITSAG